MRLLVTDPSHRDAGDHADRRAWTTLVAIIAVCFLAGVAFLVVAVWLDWQ